MAYKKIFQTILSLNNQKKPTVGEYILSNTNQEAFFYLNEWPNWKTKHCIIQGPIGSGKTYLSSLWQTKTNAIRINLFYYSQKKLEHAFVNNNYFIIENLEGYFNRKQVLRHLETNDFDCFETTILHFINICNEQNKNIIFTSNTSVSNLTIKTADLKSRLTLYNSFKLNIPNEATIKTLLVKQFSDYQLQVNNDVINFISSRIKRSFSEITTLVSEIDKCSMREKRNITIPFIKKILDTRYNAH